MALGQQRRVRNEHATIRRTLSQACQDYERAYGDHCPHYGEVDAKGRVGQDRQGDERQETDGQEQYDSYVAVEALVCAECVGDRRGRAGHPPGEEVGQDRPEYDDSITQKLLGRGTLSSELI